MQSFEYLSLILLQATPPQPSIFQILGPFVIVGLIFYFILFAPMRKRQKELERTIAELKKGDRVITNGGIYGEVSTVESNFLLLKVADDVRLKVAKSAIASLAPDAPDKRGKS